MCNRKDLISIVRYRAECPKLKYDENTLDLQKNYKFDKNMNLIKTYLHLGQQHVPLHDGQSQLGF